MVQEMQLSEQQLPSEIYTDFDMVQSWIEYTGTPDPRAFILQDGVRPQPFTLTRRFIQRAAENGWHISIETCASTCPAYKHAALSDIETVFSVAIDIDCRTRPGLGWKLARDLRDQLYACGIADSRLPIERGAGAHIVFPLVGIGTYNQPHKINAAWADVFKTEIMPLVNDLLDAYEKEIPDVRDVIEVEFCPINKAMTPVGTWRTTKQGKTTNKIDHILLQGGYLRKWHPHDLLGVPVNEWGHPVRVPQQKLRQLICDRSRTVNAAALPQFNAVDDSENDPKPTTFMEELWREIVTQFLTNYIRNYAKNHGGQSFWAKDRSRRFYCLVSALMVVFKNADDFICDFSHVIDRLAGGNTGPKYGVRAKQEVMRIVVGKREEEAERKGEVYDPRPFCYANKKMEHANRTPLKVSDEAQSFLIGWFQMAMVQEDSAATPATPVYELYCQACEKESTPPVGRTQFSRILLAHGITPDKTKKIHGKATVCIIGYSLKPVTAAIEQAIRIVENTGFFEEENDGCDHLHRVACEVPGAISQGFWDRGQNLDASSEVGDLLPFYERGADPDASDEFDRLLSRLGITSRLENVSLVIGDIDHTSDSGTAVRGWNTVSPVGVPPGWPRGKNVHIKIVPEYQALFTRHHGIAWASPTHIAIETYNCQPSTIDDNAFLRRSEEKINMCEKCLSKLQSALHTSLEKKLSNRYGPLHAEFQIDAPRLDFALPQFKIGIELDSALWHSTTGQVEWDEHREQFFRRHGWHIIRVSGSDAYNDLETTVNITEAQIRQYLVGRAMEAQHPEDIALPKKLFTRAKKLIYLTATERQIEAMLAGKGRAAATEEMDPHTSPLVVKEETPTVEEKSKPATRPDNSMQRIAKVHRRKGYTRVTPARLFTTQVGGTEAKVSMLHQHIYDYLAEHGEATTAELADALQKPEGTIRTVIGRFEWAGCFASEKRGRYNYYRVTGPFPQETAA